MNFAPVSMLLDNLIARKYYYSFFFSVVKIPSVSGLLYHVTVVSAQEVTHECY